MVEFFIVHWPISLVLIVSAFLAVYALKQLGMAPPPRHGSSQQSLRVSSSESPSTHVPAEIMEETQLAPVPTPKEVPVHQGNDEGPPSYRDSDAKQP